MMVRTLISLSTMAGAAIAAGHRKGITLVVKGKQGKRVRIFLCPTITIARRYNDSHVNAAEGSMLMKDHSQGVTGFIPSLLEHGTVNGIKLRLGSHHC